MVPDLFLPYEVTQGACKISTNPKLLNVSFIHEWLSTQSYWAKNISRDKIERIIKHALCFGVYNNGEQIGFAKVITDYATTAYIGDVFIIEAYRGKGLSKWLMETIIAHPDLQTLRRWVLATADAHKLYEKTGFKSLAKPERWMERYREDAYL
jgi:GNAT superfamily N-acetyltransferase